MLRLLYELATVVVVMTVLLLLPLVVVVTMVIVVVLLRPCHPQTSTETIALEIVDVAAFVPSGIVRRLVSWLSGCCIAGFFIGSFIVGSVVDDDAIACSTASGP